MYDHTPGARWPTSTFLAALRITGLTAPAVFEGRSTGRPCPAAPCEDGSSRRRRDPESQPVARRVAGDDATARDALQESWIIVLEKLYQYRGEPPARGWVGAIVRHEAGRGAARRNREAPLPPDRRDSVAESLDGTLHRRQLVRVLLEAIDRLPSTYRDVVRLRDLDERPVAEVARELHISRSNVAVRLHRAHKLLRRRLVRLLGAPRGNP